MVYLSPNNDQIHSKTWTKVIQKSGNEKAYAKSIGRAQSTVNERRNNPARRMLTKDLLNTAMSTGFSIETLNPCFPEDNEAMRTFQRGFKQLHAREMSLNEIIIENIPYRSEFKENDRILVDNHNVLIVGRGQIEAHKKNSQNKVKVFVVDIAALIFELLSIEQMSDFSKSERIAIGYRIKQLIGSRKGKHTQLVNLKPEKIEINVENQAKDETVRYQVEWIGKTNEHLADLLGFSGKNTYYRTEQIFNHGTQVLMDTLDQGIISIDKAFNVCKLPKDEQNACVVEAVLAHTLKSSPTQRRKKAG